MESRATMELTDSMPDNIVRISFLASTQSFVMSSGEMRLIRTRHGSNGRISRCEHLDSSRILTFCIAVKTRGDIVVLVCIIFYSYYRLNSSHVNGQRDCFKTRFTAVSNRLSQLALHSERHFSERGSASKLCRQSAPRSATVRAQINCLKRMRAQHPRYVQYTRLSSPPRCCSRVFIVNFPLYCHLKILPAINPIIYHPTIRALERPSFSG